MQYAAMQASNSLVCAMQTAIDSAETHGILFVASAGNDGLDTDVTAHYPSSMNNTNVLAVGASDSSDDLWAESNYGKTTVQVSRVTCVHPTHHVFYPVFFFSCRLLNIHLFIHSFVC